jgi:hypothetical protein
VSLEKPVLHSFGYIPKSGIAGSYGRSMFRFLRRLQIFFQSGCTSLYSHQQWVRVPFSPHPHQQLLLVVKTYNSYSELRILYVWCFCLPLLTPDFMPLILCPVTSLSLVHFSPATALSRPPPQTHQGSVPTPLPGMLSLHHWPWAASSSPRNLFSDAYFPVAASFIVQF